MLERIKDGMVFLCREAKKRGVTIALETEDAGIVVNFKVMRN